MIGKNTGLPILSGEYNRGFTASILKLIAEYDWICKDLKNHKKRMTEKLTKQWLNCCLINREKLREIEDTTDKYRGFIRWNATKGDFEWYEPNRGLHDQ